MKDENKMPAVDVKLTKFLPSLAEVPTKELEALKERAIKSGVGAISYYREVQATHSTQHPAVSAQRTIFNLVPCNRDLEVALTEFIDRAPDVAAFCKNAGPQALRLDYMTYRGQLALYTPDFLARLDGGACCIVESKGRLF